jgi:hypothetical protein
MAGRQAPHRPEAGTTAANDPQQGDAAREWDSEGPIEGQAMTTVAIIVGMSLVLAVTVFGAWYMRRKHVDAHSLEAHQDRFFEAANLLLDRDDFPHELDPMVWGMSETIGDRRCLPAFLNLIATGKMRRQLQAARKSGKSFVAFEDGVPDDLREAFVDMMRSWLLAVSHTHVVRGWFFRNLVPLVFAKPSRGAVEPQVKIFVDKVFKRHNDHDPHGLEAAA